MRTDVGTTPDGTPVEQLVLGAAPGPVLHLWTLAACVHRLVVTGGDGVRRDVVLGYDSVERRLEAGGFHGAVVGRYANRIADGDLPLPDGGADPRTVQLPTNDRGHHLHGGPDGFHRRVWTVEEQTADTARLSLVSPDGDQGYPGELRVVASYAVTGRGFTLDLAATTDATTVVNLSQHAFFNLAGLGAGTVDDHQLRVAADAYLPVDATGIPTGDPVAVDGTPFDLRSPQRLGGVVRSAHPDVVRARGLDHSFVVGEWGERRRLREVAQLTHHATRTVMRLSTDLPALQVYTGNALDGREIGHGGHPHRQGDGIALEPQLLPDSPHHPDWPSPYLRPGETWTASMAWELDGLG